MTQIERSTYYNKPICEWLEKPKNYILSPDRVETNTNETVGSIAIALLLSIPAAIGYGLSKVIYLVAGEKIKDYDTQLKAWEGLIKKADTNNSAYTVSNVAQAAIDDLIRNRKIADDSVDQTTLNSLRAKSIKVTWGIKPEEYPKYFR